MTISIYQKAIDNWMQQHAKPYWDPLSQFAHLSEEVGEVGRVLNHMYGDKIKKVTEEEDDLAGEIADVIFSAICIANRHGIDLDNQLQAVLKKSKTRDKNRFDKKA